MQEYLCTEKPILCDMAKCELRVTIVCFELLLFCELRVTGCTYCASCELQVERKLRVGSPKCELKPQLQVAVVERPF